MPAFDIRGKRVLITGCNTGIGKPTAIELARRGARVVITARSRERGAKALEEIRAASGGEVELLELELASLASVRAAAATYLARYPELHVLILNAGVANNAGRAETQDGFELMFGVNHLGHFELTRLLLDRVRASAPARIIVLSSEGYRYAPQGLDFDDLQFASRPYEGMTAYGHSKLANLLFMRELARRLEGSGVTVNAVHPGFVASELGRPRPWESASAEAAFARARAEKPELANLPPPISPEEGAATSIYLATSPDVEGTSGEYFAGCKPRRLGPAALDAEAAARLWEVSESLSARKGAARSTDGESVR
jgi:retinol dehydrogenase-13